MQANPFAILKNKSSLSHAYLVYGEFDEHKDSLAESLENSGVHLNTPGHFIFKDSTFAVEDARNLVEWYYSGRTTNDEDFTLGILAPKVFKKDAQQMLLKLFEEARHPYIFFVFIPKGTEVIETILSRVQVINTDEKDSDIASKFLKLSAGDKLKKVSQDTKGMESSEVRAYTENLVRMLVTYFHSKGSINNKEVLKILMNAQNSLAESYIAPKFILDYVVTMI